MGLFSRFFASHRAERVDARKVYDKLMAQSRKPDFFGDAKAPDTYEGRIEILALHAALTSSVMRSHGEQGRRLSQALFDEMVDDFDIALREEGLTDSGVKRRIKPIMKLVYSRLRAYTEADELSAALKTGELGDCDSGYLSSLAKYAESFKAQFEPLTLGQIAGGHFTFPEFKN